MDESMEGDDSLLSLPGPSNPRGDFLTLANSVGLGINPRIIPPNRPGAEESFESAEREWAEGASPALAEENGEIGEGEEGDEEEYGDGEGSETSSAMFDREGDPEGWAKRLDELAGVLEVGEEEARAVRWGPAIGRQRDAPDLSMEEFKALIKHHLTSTEWKYTSPSILFPPVPGRPTAAIPFLGDGLTAAGDLHPIRVIGTSWIGRDVRRLERQMEGLGDGTMGDRVEGMVGELGEAMTTRVR